MALSRVLVVLAQLAVPGCASAVQATHDFRDPSLPVEQRVEDLLGRMTLEEKLDQIRSANDEKVWREKAGQTGWGEVYDILRPLDSRAAAEKTNEVQRLAQGSRLGIPLIIRDEALHGLISNGGTSFPQSIALAASWDPELAGREAQAIAEEAKARGVRRVLCPVINVIRDARWGRVEETFGEDPVLTSRLAVPYVRGFEQHGVASTPKHFAVNAGDGGRDSHAIEISEQELREIYLAPFEAVVREGGARSIMPAYNSVNGQPCAASHHLLTDILRDEWGFTGVAGSDYGGAGGIISSHLLGLTPEQAAAKCINAGLVIEWPDVWLWGQPLEDAVAHGLVSMATIDEAARRMLRNKFELGLFEDRFVDPDAAVRIVQSPEHRAIALEAARKSIVLLKNKDHALPLKTDVASIALIGAYGNQPVPLGGYSGTNVPRQSILEALTAAAPGAKVEWAKGVDIAPDEARPVVPASQLADVRGEYFANKELQGEPRAVQADANLDFSWEKDPAPGVAPTDFSVRWTGRLLPPSSGDFTVSTTSDDGVRLWLDDQLKIDHWNDHGPTTDTCSIHVEQGRPVAFRLEYYQGGGGAVLRLGWGLAGAADPGLQDAVELARRSRVAIVVAGIREGEGQDRSSLDLPGRQEELITSVAATGTPTIVLLLAGAPVTMQRWIDAPAAILDAFYPGQEGPRAIADVLFGAVNPSGKLPITFPRSVGQCPLYYDLLPSGRGYDYVDGSGQPQFEFGFGLGYSPFEYSALKTESTGRGADTVFRISFELRNAGERDGDEIVQLYTHDLVASRVRPVKELKQFARVSLKAGESRTVQLELPARDLAFWNDEMQRVVEPGEFELMIGASSKDIRLKGTIRVE
jgi:beta-glucosidase